MGHSPCLVFLLTTFSLPCFSPSYPDILLLENRKLLLSVVAVCELPTEMSGNVKSRDVTCRI
jgi:hypothetical protein